MYRCVCWTTKKAQCWRTDVFKLWCWRRLLRLPWTARRSNQSILKDINPEYSFKGLMLRLKFHTLATWWEELTRWKRPWCWERLKIGGEGDNRGWDGWMTSLIQWTWVWSNSGRQWKIGKPGMLQSMGWHSQTQLSDWTKTIYLQVYFYLSERNKFCERIFESYKVLFSFILVRDRQFVMKICLNIKEIRAIH